MKTGIVFKLFSFTTGLCMLIIATIFIGQTVFFKKYYENQKVANTKERMVALQKKFEAANFSNIKDLKQEFYRDGTWVTILDDQGKMVYSDDFTLEVQVDDKRNHAKKESRVLKLPLYYFFTVDEIRNEESVKVGNEINLGGFEKNDTFIPTWVVIGNKDQKAKRNELLEKKLQQDTRKIDGQTTLIGTIRHVEFPTMSSSYIYSNSLFLERIVSFQGTMAMKKPPRMYTESTELAEENVDGDGVRYKFLTQPFKGPEGKTYYISAMTSLQPVSEAVQMLEGYYIYLIILVLLLTMLLSFYYSKRIARPLLQINKTTQKIAHLDFSEMVPVHSKDEIGDLSKNINELSSKLQSYIEKLQDDIEREKQLEETRKEFIASVSHELKTPLSIMKSCVSILKDGVAAHKSGHYFYAMEKEVDKMDMLIVDMLELAKFESGTYKMDMQSFYIDELVEQVCDQLSWEMVDKQLQLVRELEHVQVLSNQNRIEQVLTNFITNAIRYTPEQERIIVSIIEENEQVKVCVENKGAHISQSQIDKIWDRFYRIDAARKRSTGGTGLGLAISKKILELHGSSYGVRNTEDGVLFYFYLKKA
ncbi:HAMP domain-containing sensor histidine kinase [Thermoactinomyces sp. DSM 45892]|uniref:HAMP domain-containing sensor histidine kinase n=1 Tax=Thermoactinomyces sp. DSM 45892 TaxID=1882753 RepID=UPI00089A0CAA|nr:HAMP domain-containing sensor histidine kinase [Thermoactinomyces sp. DSM 45892]SDY25126.1 Signal transduction histidine kinase [Thermoactinomyces sp. DSM 45892]